MRLMLILNFYTSIFLASCTKPSENIRYEKYTNGKVKSMYEYIIVNGDTVANGITQSFFLNGGVFERGQMKDGQLDGLLTRYDILGDVERESFFVNGRLHGHSFSYAYPQRLRRTTIFRNDSLVLARDYFPNGKPSLLSIGVGDGNILYLCEYDSLGNKIFEQGNFSSKDTIVN